MATISLCMIVKNEEKVLKRCLDSLAGLVDELIIVDTGSTDQTKAIASAYTKQVYDFPWNNNFADARNFSFSKASMDYIYAGDADEFLDEGNRQEFAKLKKALLPEIEIVQMQYKTISQKDQTAVLAGVLCGKDASSDDAVLNAKTELRPKLFKRVRSFQWMDPIHETVRLDPVVFDSDVVIYHMPEEKHGKRDFSIFIQEFNRTGKLSNKMRTMYARELLKVGDAKDLELATPIFSHIFEACSAESDFDAMKECACVLARSYRLNRQPLEFFKITLKDMASGSCSETCYELGKFFLDQEDYQEAIMWFYNAFYESESILDIHVSGDLALKGLITCYDKLQEKARAAGANADQYAGLSNAYKKELDAWDLPDSL